MAAPGTGKKRPPPQPCVEGTDEDETESAADGPDELDLGCSIKSAEGKRKREEFAGYSPEEEDLSCREKEGPPHRAWWKITPKFKPGEDIPTSEAAMYEITRWAEVRFEAGTRAYWARFPGSEAWLAVYRKYHKHFEFEEIEQSGV